ncbi:hypothetical protein LPC08_18330 [Roseomonas sp. OT10]|uniref:hypothetical protein n=1 Tax=Roseomonas cutis TaxID=2897332 RepID=UPI001E2CDBC0|nr:hypothetical protein [Roseomonas sp. OT10]UFN47953.1 hypothetical protein LPC08_18330 [Roseomonas sp. OT10]
MSPRDVSPARPPEAAGRPAGPRHAGLRRSLRLLLAGLAGAAVAAGLYVGSFAALVPHPYVPNLREALLLHAPGPRLILESGSSALHGLDATALGHGLNRTGISIADNGGYNGEHKAWRLLAWARPGDAVVLPLEWIYYDRPDALYESYLRAATTLLPHYFLSLPWAERLRVIAALPLSEGVAILWRNAGATLRGAKRDDTSRLLEMHRWLAEEHRDGGATDLPPAELRPEAQALSCDGYLFPDGMLERGPDPARLATLLRLLDRLHDRGVSVVLVPPVVAGEDCYADPAALESYLARLRGVLAGAGLFYLGDPRDFRFGPESLRDTYYHVDHAARATATARLLTLLRQAGLSGPEGVPPPGLAATVVALERAHPARSAWPGEALPAGAEVPGGSTMQIEAVAGWWPPEDGARWTRGGTAVLRLRLPPKHPSLALHLQAQGAPRGVEAWIANRLAASGVIGPDPQWLTVPLPADAERVELVLRPAAPQPPADAAGPDRGLRLLGVAARP